MIFLIVYVKPGVAGFVVRNVVASLLKAGANMYTHIYQPPPPQDAQNKKPARDE